MIGGTKRFQTFSYIMSLSSFQDLHRILEPLISYNPKTTQVININNSLLTITIIYPPHNINHKNLIYLHISNLRSQGILQQLLEYKNTTQCSSLGFKIVSN